MIEYLSKIITFNKLNIIGIIKKEHSEVFNLLTIHKKGSKLNILSSRKFNSFEDLQKAINDKNPIVINIDGKGILNKRIDSENDADASWLKTINFNTIYHTTYQQDEISYMSFCRESVVQETIKQFTDAKLEVLDIYIGSFIGALLKDFIAESEYISGELLLDFEENELVHFTKNEDKNPTFKIGETHVMSSHLPLYACALHFYLQPDTLTKSESNINLDEVIYKKAFNTLGAAMLVLFFILLLFSYSLIQYYGSKNSELNLKNLYSDQSYKKLKSLEKKREQQLLILGESGLASTTFISHHVYDILKTVPANIKLNELNYFPVDKEIKPEKKVLFTAKTILIKGETNEETTFNNWISNIKATSWVKKFEIINLKKDKKNVSHFEVKILVNHV